MFRMFLQFGYTESVKELHGKVPSTMAEAIWEAEEVLRELGFYAFTHVTKPDGTVMLIPDGVNAMSDDVPAVMVEYYGDRALLS